MKNEQRRGLLTNRIKAKSKELLGYEISQEELRLIPYLQFVMVNEHEIDFRKINAEEMAILELWEDKGYLKKNIAGDLEITKDFWNILCEIIYLGYVDVNLNI